jgi:hypothetical protein
MTTQRSFSIVIALLVCGAAFAADPSPKDVEFFEKKVRPILVEQCYNCHSEAKKKHKGGLVVDSRSALLQGGDTGPAIVPGEPDKSRLIEAIRYTNPDMQMPPKGKLSEEEIASLTTWVKQGAAWPSDGNTSQPKRTPGKITEEDRRWWAFQQLKRPAVPPLASNAIDAFINEKLFEKQLSPAPVADKRALIRRVTLDLTGLPPTLDEVNAFLEDQSPDAYLKLVNRLLASPRFGERSARFWLDLVRYADSDGYRIDDYRPNAWRYRDYVIRSFNADKPYDRFVQEQLAGDELFPGDSEALIATGYLRHWIYEYNQRDVKVQWNLILDDITDTTGDVFLGLGMQCARCHDHKFDPILQKDYYRLRAFFAGLLPRDDLIAATETERKNHAEKLQKWEKETATIREEIAKIEAPYRAKVAEAAIIKFPEDIQRMIRKSPAERTPLEHQFAELAYRQVDYEFERIERNLKGADKERYLALKRELAKFEHLKPAPLPAALAASDLGRKAAVTQIPKKGSADIEPGYLTLLSEQPAKIDPLANSTGRRTTLAKWLTRPENPLTARVLVNRLWQQHFGRGLAANASDFGKLGELPTHPALLDWLASELVSPASGQPWSMKHIHRLIVTSDAYKRSASHPDPKNGRLVDPENKLLWRGNVRRLDAEQIRDSLLAVTGELDLKSGGPGVAPNDPRRAIYCRIMRNNRDPLLDVFDAPYWFSSASSRDTTTTAVQSLLLVNNQLLLQRARGLADRAFRDEPSSDSARLDRLYRWVYGRLPTAEEQAVTTKFLAEQPKRIDLKKAPATKEFLAGKIPYRDGQAAEIKLGEHPGFEVPHHANFPKADFTIEGFIYPRSIAENGAVRTIAAKWDGNPKSQGWSFGITGKQSRRKPQTLVLQLYGKKRDGSFGEEALFSDQHISLNKPYYVAVSVLLAKDQKPGQVTFHLKDLSNDDEPLLQAKLPHQTKGELENKLPMTMGNRNSKTGAGFDGLLDDVRLSDTALSVDQLLFTREGANQQTIGYWQFEQKPSVFKDGSGHGYDIRPGKMESGVVRDVRRQAWIDLCHALLNSSEFLYAE